MNSGLVTLLLDRGRLGVPDPNAPRRGEAEMGSRGYRRGVLPAGAGAVICIECGAGARADGKGTPIVIHHDETCSEHPKNQPPLPAKRVWYVDASMYEVGKGFRPVIAVDGEAGFFPNGNPEAGHEPFYVGHDYATAKRIVAEWNFELGFEPDEVENIVLDSMFPERRGEK